MPNIGVSSSASSGAGLSEGDWTVTGGGNSGKGGGVVDALTSALPKVSSDQSWVVWLGVAALVTAGVVALFYLLYNRKE